MENQMYHSDSLGELIPALIKVQGNLKSAPKSKLNPFHKSKYADLPLVWEMCRELLSANGLVITQLVQGSKDEAHLVTMLIHTSNQWIKSAIPLLLVKQDPQAQGSAITYARRYGLMAILGMCQDEEDDDAQAATHPPREEKPPVEKKKDMSQHEIEQYLAKWGDLKEKMRNYLTFVKDTKKAKSWREVVELLAQDEDRTKTAFNSWLEKNKAA